METEPRYSLAELARVTGVTPRTVRYYIAQGLLPGANETGPGAWYDEHHLARLRLIRELQRQHLPLAEIRQRLSGLEAVEVETLLEERQAAEVAPTTSALDYIRGVLGTAVSVPPAALASSAPPAPRLRAAPFLKRSDVIQPAALTIGSIHDLGTGNVDAAPIASPSAPTAERSQWDRIALTNDIELHVRRPLRRIDQKRVERLITIARQVLGEEQP